MILGFKQNFPWKEPTYFREKILSGANRMEIVSKERIDYMTDRIHVKVHAPKIHTMREDKHDRWKSGSSIQMVYRGPKYSILDHFNKGIPELEQCISTQKIKLWYTGSLSNAEREEDRKLEVVLHCMVDDKRLSIQEIEKLAINDGFNSLDDFKKWFNKGWEGKIIHWSDFRYE